MLDSTRQTLGTCWTSELKAPSCWTYSGIPGGLYHFMFFSFFLFFFPPRGKHEVNWETVASRDDIFYAVVLWNQLPYIIESAKIVFRDGNSYISPSVDMGRSSANFRSRDENVFHYRTHDKHLGVLLGDYLGHFWTESDNCCDQLTWKFETCNCFI